MQHDAPAGPRYAECECCRGAGRSTWCDTHPVGCCPCLRDGAPCEVCDGDGCVALCVACNDYAGSAKTEARFCSGCSAELGSLDVWSHERAHRAEVA